MPPPVPVWDPAVRVLHWALVATVAAAWLTRHGGGAWHEWLGYATLAILALRLAWGLVGPRRARFASFVRGPAATLAYARSVLARRERRFVGHNPLGAWMIVALIGAIAAVDLTGWIYTTDRFWGVAWVEALHDSLSSVLLALVALHVAGVALSSWRHGENLVVAMIHGRKRAPSAGDAD
ncbi:MAG TPA: cytochrome b/b6 domain-containing protein [Burkholderiales bacterium]|nr:cytochrome b/b6 domain-containing protein [Burkholderiales bacterium]